MTRTFRRLPLAGHLLPTGRLPVAAVILALAGPLAATPAPAEIAPARVRVLPPPRPADLVDGPDDNLITGSIVPSRTGDVSTGRPLPLHSAAAPEKTTVNGRVAIEKANAALNATTSMAADFTQINGDGRRVSGTLYLQRPGKVRFEYDKPSTLEVVSDGSTVLVRDRKLNTADPYPIGQTPLKFLLNTRIDLSRDATVMSVTADDGAVRIQIEDRATLGGTSRITLSFDPDITGLRGWKVLDPQGTSTTVALSDIEKNRTIDPRIFMLNYMRPAE